MKISRISKTYSGRKVLDTEAFELEEGKIHIILGANGSGKSTFARILSGLEKSDAGNRPLAAGITVGYLTQKPYAFRMSTEKNLLIASDDTDRMNELISQLNLEELRKNKSNFLSGGETGRMALARILMKRFDLLILDEPTAAMDMESTFLAEQAIKDYQARYSPTILMITHSIGQARRVGDNLLFFNSGRIDESGDCSSHLSVPQSESFRRFLEFQQ